MRCPLHFVQTHLSCKLNCFDIQTSQEHCNIFAANYLLQNKEFDIRLHFMEASNAEKNKEGSHHINELEEKLPLLHKSVWSWAFFENKKTHPKQIKQIYF